MLRRRAKTVSFQATRRSGDRSADSSADDECSDSAAGLIEDFRSGRDLVYWHAGGVAKSIRAPLSDAQRRLVSGASSLVHQPVPQICLGRAQVLSRSRNLLHAFANWRDFFGPRTAGRQ